MLTRTDFRVVLTIVMNLVTAKTPFEGVVSFNGGHSKGKQNDQIHIYGSKQQHGTEQNSVSWGLFQPVSERHVGK